MHIFGIKEQFAAEKVPYHFVAQPISLGRSILNVAFAIKFSIFNFQG
jgi:hypothetical protein